MKTRREDIKRDDQLFRDRSEELEDVRRQISMIDRQWDRLRWKEDIDRSLKPLVTGREWIELQRFGHNDWVQWEEMNSADQRQQMIEASLVFPKPAGFVGDGNDSDGGERGRQVVSSVRNSLAVPPSTNSSSHRGADRPLEVMPHSHDVSRSSGREGRVQPMQNPQVRPAAPAVAKPAPPNAPVGHRRSQEGVGENQRRISAERCRRRVGKISLEVMCFLDFGLDPRAGYEQAWAWCKTGQKTLSDVMQGCELGQSECLKFARWFHRKQELMERNSKDDCIIHFVWLRV